MDLPVTSYLLGPNILVSTVFSDILSLYSFVNVTGKISHTYQTTGKIIVYTLFIYNYIVF
jgi:hypothetical protein